MNYFALQELRLLLKLRPIILRQEVHQLIVEFDFLLVMKYQLILEQKLLKLRQLCLKQRAQNLVKLLLQWLNQHLIQLWFEQQMFQGQ